MRDVTPRYAKQYSAKVAKAQAGGRGRREWWYQVVSTVTRPLRLVRNLGSLLYPDLMWSASLKHRDDVEDDELVVDQFIEGMPTTMTGFKGHPLCASNSFFWFTSRLSPNPVMCWSVICFETRLSRWTRTNSASSAASRYILAARFCISRQRRSGYATDALCARASSRSSMSSSARRHLAAGVSLRYVRKRKARTAPAQPCRAYIRKDRPRHTFHPRSSTYVLFVTFAKGFISPRGR
jgi:hypothetical protein